MEDDTLAYSPNGERIAYTGFKGLGSDDESFHSEIYTIISRRMVNLELQIPHTTPAILPGESSVAAYLPGEAIGLSLVEGRGP
jgi:hypothetical protein